MPNIFKKLRKNSNKPQSPFIVKAVKDKLKSTCGQEFKNCNKPSKVTEPALKQKRIYDIKNKVTKINNKTLKIKFKLERYFILFTTKCKFNNNYNNSKS